MPFARQKSAASDGCFIIGEIGMAHDGSLGFAHAFIDAIAVTGADAVKLQTHIAAAESSPGEPFRVRMSGQDASRYDYWIRTGFTEDQWRELARHARDKGLVFVSSPFSGEAVDLLMRSGVDMLKIASGEVSNTPLLEQAARTGKPVLVSSGMSGLDELDEAVATVRRAGGEIGVFQCTTAYPCPPEKIGLNLVDEFRRRYGCPVGLSDHSGTLFPGLAGVAMGMELFEAHVTLSREMYGPDVPASLTTGEFKTLVDGVRFIETMKRAPVDKDTALGEFSDLRDIFTKSVVARCDIPADTVLEAHHLTVKKPGTGIPARQLSEMIGRRTRRPINANQLLSESDLVAIH